MDRRHAGGNIDAPDSLVQSVAWAFVGLGIVVRLARYLLHFPLWGDEASLAVHFLDRDFAGLLQPLKHDQVAPLLHLWLQLAAVKLLGFSEWSLRLFPTLFSIASLLMFRSLASRLLKGWPYALAVGVFAASYFIIRHGAEAKPYAGDLLAALIVLWLAVVWLENTSHTWPLWLMALAAPICLGMSFTAPFVLCGTGLALLPAVWRTKQPGVWLAYGACAVSTLAAGLALYLFFIAPQFAATGPVMVNQYWRDAFPPLDNALAFVLWLVKAHSGRMLAYPLGSQNGASAGTLLLCLVALVIWWRQGRREWIALCLLPLALGFLAAVMRKYPYGESARTMQYIAPAVCLLFGVGLAAAISWQRRVVQQQRALAVACLLLALIGGGLMIKDLVQPYKTRFEHVNREFARWFWRDQAVDAELVCAARDLGLPHPEIDPSGIPTNYFCNQRIYSQQCGRGQSPAWTRISDEHPLRVALHTVEGYDYDSHALDAWLSHLQAERGLKLVGIDHYRLNPGAEKFYAQRIDVLELVPNNSLRASLPWPARQVR